MEKNKSEDGESGRKNPERKHQKNEGGDEDEVLARMTDPVEADLIQVTLVMCQTRFKISKEISREVYPPILRSKECWFLYTVGNPDSFKCVLRIFVVITSPVLSLISTALLLFGKLESNPYLFIPWLFLTMKGLLLVQTDNLITILRDMSTRENYTFGFRMEDLKWMLFYFTIFMIDLVETFSFCEIFDIFLVLWNHQPKYNLEAGNLESIKKDIADIMKSLSKCSLGSLSKISLGSMSDSEGTNESNVRGLENSMKYSTKVEDKFLYESAKTLSNGDDPTKCEFDQGMSKSSLEAELKNNQNFSVKPTSEGDTIAPFAYEKLLRSGVGDLNGFDTLNSHKIKLKAFSPLEVRQEFKSRDLSSDPMQEKNLPADIVCS